MLPIPPQPQTPDALNPNLGAALAAFAAGVPPERIDQVWIFPPRQIGARESGLAVLALFEAGDEARGRRTLLTLRYEAEPLKGGKVKRTDQAAEEGSVPVDRVARILEGVARRLNVETETPAARDVGGDSQAWAALLAELGAGPVDAANR